MSVFLAYHDPCLDGAYSVSMAYLFFRDIQRSGLTTKDFNEYISTFTSFSGIDKSLYESKGKHLKEAQDKEETKFQDFKSYSGCSHDYSPSNLKQVVYVPSRQEVGEFFETRFRLYSPEVLAESVLIMMDYNTGDAGKIERLCNLFSKVIIIDHHLTFEHLLENFVDPPKNLLYLYNREKSGATLSLEFFEKVKGAPLLADKQKYLQLKEVLSYVEDYDMKAGKVKNSDEFVCGLLIKRMNFDANWNSSLFRDLIEANPDKLIEIGTNEYKSRIQKSKEVVKRKHLVYLGGKTKDNKGRFGICYGAEVLSQELRTEVGGQLAQLSYDDKLENMGFVYNIERTGKVKVSLRSIKGLPGGDCEIIARSYQGGGHFNAAGFALSSAEFRKWI